MRTLRLLGLALLAGLAIGVLKGNGDPTRDAIGNLSAPWLLIPLLAGWPAGRWWRGALAGWVTTLVGLLGFYLGMFAYVHAHLGFSSPWHAWWFLVRANDLWFRAGLVSGPVLGALAALLGARVARGWLGLSAGALLLGEPIATRLADGGMRVGLAWRFDDAAAYPLETALGVVVVAASIAALLRRRLRPSG